MLILTSNIPLEVSAEGDTAYTVPSYDRPEAGRYILAFIPSFTFCIFVSVTLIVAVKEFSPVITIEGVWLEVYSPTVIFLALILPSIGDFTVALSKAYLAESKEALALSTVALAAAILSGFVIEFVIFAFVLALL